MSAFHDLGHNPKHHRAADIRDHGVMEKPIIDLCIGSNEEASPFTRTIADDQVNRFLFPLFIIRFNLHMDGVVIENDRLDHCSQVHQKAAQNGEPV